MDGSRFDAWTRRRLHLAAGGVAGSLLAVSGIAGAGAKKNKPKNKNKKNKKHKKKRKAACGQLNDSCSFEEECCCGFRCRDIDTALRCCRATGAACTAATADECCSGMCELGDCVCNRLDQPCTQHRQCCSGFCNTQGGGFCQE